MKLEKEERLTVLVRGIAEELMRKEWRPVSVSEIQCYMSKMNPELSRKVSGKSVDYVRAVLGTSRVGRFRKFRCPSWVGLGSGESPRKLYWGECGVRYGEEWERESEEKVEVEEGGGKLEGSRKEKGRRVRKVGVGVNGGGVEKWNGVGVVGGVGVGGVGVGVGEVFGGVLGCVEGVESVWGKGMGRVEGEREVWDGGEWREEGLGAGEGWWKRGRNVESDVEGVSSVGGVSVSGWGEGRGLGNESESEGREREREWARGGEGVKGKEGSVWEVGESYESVVEEWWRVGSEWEEGGGESVWYEWW